MKLRNVWFDLVSFLGAWILAFQAGIMIWRDVRGDVVDQLSNAIAATVFALLAFWFFRLSLRIGDDQMRARERWKSKWQSKTASSSDREPNSTVTSNDQGSLTL